MSTLIPIGYQMTDSGRSERWETKQEAMTQTTTKMREAREKIGKFYFGAPKADRLKSLCKYLDIYSPILIRHISGNWKIKHDQGF
jgi:hypothetical protein